MVVPGLPAVVIGQTRTAKGTGFASTHTWLGMIESVQHSYSQGGATTAISLGTCRPYKTGPESIDELLKLKKAGSNLFKNQDPSYAAVLGASLQSVPSYFTFATKTSLLKSSNLTTFEKIVQESAAPQYGFPGPDFFITPESIITMVFDACSAASNLRKLFGLNGLTNVAKFAQITLLDGRSSFLPVDILHVGYPTPGAAAPVTGVFDLVPIKEGSNLVFQAKFRTSEYYGSAYQRNFSAAYSDLNSVNLLGNKASASAGVKALATATAAITKDITSEFQASLDKTEYLIEAGDSTYKKVVSIQGKPQTHCKNTSITICGNVQHQSS